MGLGRLCQRRRAPLGRRRQPAPDLWRTGREPGHFRLPHGIDVDVRDRVWVADRENARVQLFSNEGEFLREWPNRLRPAEYHCTPDHV